MEAKIVKALEIIEALDWDTVECGKYVVDDDIFYMVQEYETKYSEQCRYEAHQKYVDIQYIIKGVERMEFADTPKMKVTEKELLQEKCLQGKQFQNGVIYQRKK
jgi:YhcH/YjgK/YiaL family protein